MFHILELPISVQKGSLAWLAQENFHSKDLRQNMLVHFVWETEYKISLIWPMRIEPIANAKYLEFIHRVTFSEIFFK